MDISKIVYDYFFANKEELRQSPFKLREPKPYYDPSLDSDYFIKVGMPFFAEMGLFCYFLFSPNLNLTAKIIGAPLVLGDIISREKGVKKTDTYCYSLIGRTRDIYKNLIKK